MGIRYIHTLGTHVSAKSLHLKLEYRYPRRGFWCLATDEYQSRAERVSRGDEIGWE